MFEVSSVTACMPTAGNWLQVAQQAFEAEREARLATMAEADAAREARLVAEAQARKALIAAEAEARDARRWRDQAQAHAAARLQADTTLSELLQSKTGRQETLEEERRVLLKRGLAVGDAFGRNGGVQIAPERLTVFGLLLVQLQDTRQWRKTGQGGIDGGRGGGGAHAQVAAVIG